MAIFSTNFANLCWTYAEIWVIYYVYCQNSICIMGCHGNGYILYSLNEIFLEDIFSHLVGPSEQIVIGVQDRLNWLLVLLT